MLHLKNTLVGYCIINVHTTVYITMCIAEVLPVYGNQNYFLLGASAHVDPVKSSGDQWQWELSRNCTTYSEQTSNISHEMEESTKYKSESCTYAFHTHAVVICIYLTNIL